MDQKKRWFEGESSEEDGVYGRTSCLHLNEIVCFIIFATSVPVLLCSKFTDWLLVQQKIFYFSICYSNKPFEPPSYCGHIYPCLPHLFSQNVVFVLSVQAGELYHKLLHSKKHVNDFVVGDLKSMERAEMVRRTLAVHRKALEESMFNNQVTKLENF